MTVRSVIGGHISGVRGNRNRCSEGDLLPARGGFARKRGAREKGTRVAPEVAQVSACIRGRFVEADASYIAGDIRLKPYAKLEGVAVPGVDVSWNGGTAPDGVACEGYAWAKRPGQDQNGDDRGDREQIL